MTQTKRLLMLLALAVLFLIIAWGIARAIPIRAAVSPRLKATSQELSPSLSVAEFCAVVNTQYAIMLTQDDVGAYRFMTNTGTQPAEALRAILLYRASLLHTVVHP